MVERKKGLQVRAKDLRVLILYQVVSSFDIDFLHFFELLMIVGHGTEGGGATHLRKKV